MKNLQKKRIHRVLDGSAVNDINKVITMLTVKTDMIRNTTSCMRMERFSRGAGA